MQWLDFFPSSYYKISAPLSSNPSPLITFLLKRSIHKKKGLCFKTTRLERLLKRMFGIPPLIYQIDYTKLKKRRILSLLELVLRNVALIHQAKDVNERYYELVRREHMWIKQRAKPHWLMNTEDNIKFIYCSLKERKLQSHQRNPNSA